MRLLKTNVTSSNPEKNQALLVSANDPEGDVVFEKKRLVNSFSIQYPDNENITTVSGVPIISKVIIIYQHFETAVLNHRTVLTMSLRMKSS